MKHTKRKKRKRALRSYRMPFITKSKLKTPQNTPPK